MTAIVLRGDARQLPLPDGCVDLIVTSPPYFGLRSYTDGGEHYAGQIGSEATPAEYLEALWACTAEWARVLKPGGSMFINLGDKYTGSGGDGNSGLLTPKYKANTDAAPPSRGNLYGARPKSLLGIPWRYAIGATDRLGLTLRAEIIWAKPNGLPESVTDRVRRAHEQVFHFTRSPRYYAAVDEIREPHARTWRAPGGSGNPGTSMVEGRLKNGSLPTCDPNPLGKLPGSVWPIPSAPLTVPPALGVDHFAAFPPALVRPLVLGWSPPGVCTACGEGRRPVVDKTLSVNHVQRNAYLPGLANDHPRWDVPVGADRVVGMTTATITGYACACPTSAGDGHRWCSICGRVITTKQQMTETRHGAMHYQCIPIRPAVVLDPFAGTGTTMLVASAYGRIGVGVDRSADYCRLAAWRVRDPGERARARDMPKPPPVPTGMEPLFEMGAS